jgi:TolB-like protein
MGSDPRLVYRFDRFTLNLIRGVLLAPDGSELALRPKSFDMLRFMVTHAGRLMDRDELMQAVWPGVIVTDDSITQSIMDIRRALGDQTQRLLRTVPRRGYLFDVAVSCSAADEPSGPSAVGTNTNGIASPLPMPATDRPMIVILPFENLGRDPQQDYLANGMTTDLVTDLTHFRDLCVVTPPQHTPSSGLTVGSVSSWAIPDAARYVVTGSVRRAGERIRVTIRLSDARTGGSLWAERFDRPLDELFGLQDELAERLPAHLVSQIEQEATQRSRRRPTHSLDAYTLCLQGRELHLRATEAETLAARSKFSQAIELDPHYAAAYAWQAYTVQRGFTHLWGEPRGPAAAVEALTLARRGVEIEPNLSFCLGTLAFVLLLNADWDEALDVARAAVRANPCAAESRYGYGEVLTHAGDPVEAECEIRLALSLNPFHPPSWRALLGRALLVAGRFEEALAELRFCAERMPQYGPCYHAVATAAAEMGRVEEARWAVRSLLRGNPNLTIDIACGCLFFRDPAVTERFRAGFRAGGMPEGSATAKRQST